MDNDTSILEEVGRALFVDANGHSDPAGLEHIETYIAERLRAGDERRQGAEEALRQALEGDPLNRVDISLLSPYQVMRMLMDQMADGRSRLDKGWRRVCQQKFAYDGEMARLGSRIGSGEGNRLRSRLEGEIMKAVLELVEAMEDHLPRQALFLELANTDAALWTPEVLARVEAASHVRAAFHEALRDFMTRGTLSTDTWEHLTRLGIHPVVAEQTVQGYLNTCVQQLADEDGWEAIDYGHLMDFLDRQAVRYADARHQIAIHAGLRGRVKTAPTTMH